VIYLDYQATTPLGPEAVAAMEPWLRPGVAANPHSAHRDGARAHAALEHARCQIAAALHAAPEAVRFTSGATEADNWALTGALTAPGQTRRRVVTLATEHSAVMETARALERMGAALTVLPVQPDGLIDFGALDAALASDVALVSAMLVNNEIGVIQPIAAIAARARAVGALMHCDAAQGFGRLAFDPEALSVDLASLSAHKIHGPVGIGALWVRPGIALGTIAHGGGQEPGRSGTVSVALAAGFGAAAEAAAGRRAAERAHVDALWERALARLAVAFRINGSTADRWRGNLNLSFPGADGARLLSEVTREVSCSSGSACASAAGRDSHVLKAIGVAPREARATLRLGWGRFTTGPEIDAAIDAVNRAARLATRAVA